MTPLLECHFDANLMVLSRHAEVMFDAFHYVTDDYLGFDEVIVDTERFGALFVFGLAQGGQHDDPDIRRIRRITEDVQHVKPTDFWHHRVKQDKVRLEFDRSRQRILSVIYFPDRKPFEFES